MTRKPKQKTAVAKSKTNPTPPPPPSDPTPDEDDSVCEECGERCGFVYIKFCNECQQETAPDGCPCRMWLDEGTYTEAVPACFFS